MPNKAKATTIASSTSRDLVPVGLRDLSAKVRQQGKLGELGVKPTTARALVLRNGKHGIRGTGEVMLVGKLTGREKLDLLAEDLVAQSKKAVLSPFKLEECLKITQSQRNAFLDDIANLRDPDLFFHLVEAELSARTPRDSKKGDPVTNASYIASVVATKIHNSYLIASAWTIVSNTFNGLAEEGLTDKTIKTQLKNDQSFRARYLVLYDMVSVLVNISQAKFSVLATTAPHYSRYFKPADGSDIDGPAMIFDWAELKDACVSFLDSIILELCFPRAPYPRAVLYQVLRDAVEESPRDAKRFPQTLWDAVGDLSVSIELQELMEAPLLGPEGDVWRSMPREMPEEFEHWVDAQLYSERASEIYANYEDIIFPLEKTKNRATLENMWKYVNLNYKAASGDDIDTLWRLNGALDPSPKWHSFYMPEIHLSMESDAESDSPRGRALPSRKRKFTRPLAITDNATNDSDSIPELWSASNSSDEEYFDEHSRFNDNDGDNDSGYDTEQEDDIREKLREAMDTVHETGGFDSANIPGDIDPFLQESYKANPFLKFLDSVKNRMFSSNPKLRTTRQEAQEPNLGHASKSTMSSPRAETVSIETPKTHKSTVVHVEDEDDVYRSLKKKKKKKKPKKKLVLSEPSAVLAPLVEAPQATPAAKLPISSSPLVSPAKTDVSTAYEASLSTQKPRVTKPVLAQMSAPSLPLPVEPATAQSARSYIHSENLANQRSKTKSRPDHTSFLSNPAKRGMFSTLGFGESKIKNKEKEPVREGARHSWFSKLGKKTTGYMHQLLSTAEQSGTVPMKWTHFLKIMREMGFTYDPSTAGSSVRFDPPDPRDKPITFHRPHPDATLQPILLKNFGKRLKKQYGWTAQDFVKQVS